MLLMIHLEAAKQITHLVFDLYWQFSGLCSNAVSRGQMCKRSGNANNIKVVEDLSLVPANHLSQCFRCSRTALVNARQDPAWLAA